MKKRRIVAVVTACLMTILPLFPAQAQDTAVPAQEEKTEKVILYHTNDTHGALTGGKVSIAQAAAMKKQTENAFLVDAGDATQGLPLASLTKGSDVIRLMNQAGYDAMCTGNHEFDYGKDTLLENAKNAAFPILAANAFYQDKLLLQSENQNGGSTVLETGDKKIGVFGIITKDTATSTNPDGIKGIEFRDEVQAAKEQVDLLEKENVDAIVALCHMGNEAGTSCGSHQMAEALTGQYQGKVDVIIDGHSHEEKSEEVNDILIAQTGYNMGGLGKVTLDFSSNEPKASEELLTAEDIQVEPDAATQALLDEITGSQKDLLEQQIADIDQSLWGGWIENAAVSRRAQTNLGELITDTFVKKTQKMMAYLPEEEYEKYKNVPVVAVENGGGIRGSLKNGTVTKGDVLTVFPFSNTMIAKEITPAILYTMLEQSVIQHMDQDVNTGMLTAGDNGSFLQASGFSFTYDPRKPEGSKVTKVWIPDESGEKVLERDDDTSKMILSTNSYIAAGGGGYEVLAGCKTIGEGVGEAELLESVLKEKSENGEGFTPVRFGAIPQTEGYKAENYTALVKITDTKGNPLINQEVSYYVDGKKINSKGKTDRNGFLKVSGLQPGGHSIRLDWNGTDVYVNQYIGMGVTETEDFPYPALVLDTPVKPDPEDSLKAPKIKAAANVTSAKVSWTSVSGASGYQIYRSTKKGSTGIRVASPSVKTSSWTDKNLLIGKTYYYKVRAYKKNGSKTTYGKFSGSFAVTPKPAVPTFKLSALNNGIKVTWNKASGASGYKIYRATSKNGTYKVIKNAKSTERCYTSKYLKDKKTYYYKMRSYKVVNGKNVYSKYSIVKSVRTK